MSITMRIVAPLIFIFALLLASSSFGRSIVELSEKPTQVSLQGKIELYIEEPSARPKTLADIQGQDFRLQSSDLLNFDYNDKIHWLRFTLQHQGESPLPLTLEIPTSWLDRVTFYERQGQSWTETTSGDSVESPAPKTYRYPTFDLNVPPGAPVDYYLRVEGEDALVLPLRLTSPEVFHERSLIRAYGLGAYGGLILVLTLYNFIVFVSLRDRNYLFYVLYIISMGLLQALYEGFGTQYLWFQNPWVANRMLAVITYLPMFFALLFTLGFLDIKKKSPRMLRVLQCVFLLLLGLSFSAFSSSNYSTAIQTASLTSFLFTILLITVGIIMLRKSSRAARFYLLAWIPLLLSVLGYVLALRAFIPANALTTNFVYYGSALESILLSLALADRMKMLIRKQSRLTSQLEAAQCVQNSLIFDKAEIPGLKYSTYYKSADITGGDWYGLFDDAKNSRSYILIGDVTGHGISSALVTGAVAGAAEVAIHLIAEKSLPLLESVTSIAKELNRVVLKTGQASGEMMTMALIGIERQTLQAAYVNCGHTHICVASQGRVKSRLEPGSLLGTEDLNIGGKVFTLNQGDIIFVFTDGLLENHALRQKPIRWKNIAEILAHRSEPRQITQDVGDLVQKVTRGESLNDDCTFLAIQIQDHKEGTAAA